MQTIYNLNTQNNTHTQICTHDMGQQSIHATQAGEYFCCIIAHDAQGDIAIHADVADITMRVVVINYATDGHPVTMAIHAYTDHNNVSIDMSIVSLVGKGANVDIVGAIIMPSGVKNTKGYLMEDTLLLHPTARAKVLPKLDIHANDVQASHGAKIHTIDDESLFYIQARGLSGPESKKLYIQGYIQALLDTIPTLEQQYIQMQQENICKTLVL